MASDGYEAVPLRTGYERVMAHRVDDLYAYTAKLDGTVIDKSADHITIRYKDDSEVTIELGTRYGSTPGSVIPHDVISELSVGDTFKEGNVVSYNTGFFTPDPLDPTQVLLKTSILAKTAIMERSHTFEDASVISQSLADKLMTKTTKVRTIRLNFNQNIHNLVKLGTDVDIETILCTIEDATSNNTGLFTDDSIDSLKLLSGNTPKAKARGFVEKIDVFYHGDIEDMSQSLRELVSKHDRTRLKRLKKVGKPATTGLVDGNMRIEGNPVDLDSVAIQIYITGPMGAQVGDKGVFGNQMKTVFSHVMSGINETESGVQVDALFSYLSINNRIVLSPEIIGTTNTLLKVMSKRVADKYFQAKSK